MTLRSHPSTSTVPLTCCSSNDPPGCSGYDWLKSLLFARHGAEALNAIARMNNTAERKPGRSIAFYPLRVHLTSLSSLLQPHRGTGTRTKPARDAAPLRLSNVNAAQNQTLPSISFPLEC